MEQWSPLVQERRPRDASYTTSVDANAGRPSGSKRGRVEAHATAQRSRRDSHRVGRLDGGYEHQPQSAALQVRRLGGGRHAAHLAPLRRDPASPVACMNWLAPGFAAWYGPEAATRNACLEIRCSAERDHRGETTVSVAIQRGRQAATSGYLSMPYANEPMDTEANVFHDHFRAIPFMRLAALLSRCRVSVNRKNWLIAGCGRGTDLHYLTRIFDANWTASDISSAAVRATQAAFPEVKVLVADLEHLPFQDDEFDVGFVAATLHHLPRPLVGLYELLRVSRDAAILIEPNDSWLTRLATRLGAAHEYEEAGNYVYRLSASDVRRVAKAAFCTAHVDRFFATYRVAKSPSEFLALRALNRTANVVAPRLGNYIIAVLEM